MKRFAAVLLTCLLAALLTAAVDSDERVTVTVVDAQRKPVSGVYLSWERLNPPPIPAGQKGPPAIGDDLITDANGQAVFTGYEYPHDLFLIDTLGQFFYLNLTGGGDRSYTLPLRPNPTPDPMGAHNSFDAIETELYVVDPSGKPVTDLVIEGADPSGAVIPAKKTDAQGSYACGVLTAKDRTAPTGFARYNLTLSNPYAQPNTITRSAVLKMGVYLRGNNYGGKLLATYIWEDEKPADSLAGNKNKSVLYLSDAAGRPVQGLAVQVYDETGLVMDGYTDYGGKFIILGDVRAALTVRCTDRSGKTKLYEADTTAGGDLSFPLLW